jgi:hypothetical protein
MTHCNVNARNNTHHILACFVNLLIMLFKVLQLLFDILLDCGVIFLNIQSFQFNLIHRFNNCFVVFICGFNHW